MKDHIHYIRFSQFNPIADFYRKRSNWNKPLSTHLIKKWYDTKIVALKKLGYKENIKADVTGGDHDYMIVDHQRKEWCWWENGFHPFCSSPFPTTHTLDYWSSHRS